MKTFNHFLRSALFLTALVLSVFSCNMFDASVNDYLSYYTQGIFASEISPYENMPSKYINGILYIPSNLEQYYCLEFYYSDTKNREHVRFCYKDALDTTRDFPGYSSSADYYADLDHNNHHCKIYFSPSYLKSKDKETADRNINLKLLFQYASTDDFADPIDTEPFYLNCVVNTPPEILEDNYTYCKLIVDGVKRNILCFNIKPEEENLYGDLKNSNGNYTIKINGTPYEFYFDTTTHKPVFQGPNKFYSSISSIPGGSGPEYPEGGFEAKTNPVYFVTDENTEKLYEILIVDNHGLEKKYTISTKPSGKQKLNLNVSGGTDFIEITPDFTALPQKQGETPITVNNLTLVYTIDDGEVQKCSITNSTPFRIYVPGGTERINYYMKTDQPDINQSEHKETKFTLQKKIYVRPTQEDSNYRGGTSDTPWNIKDALEYLGHQTGEWTLDVGNWEYIAMSEADIDAVGKSFIYVKKDPSVNVKINIEGKSDTQRATFNANGNGRVFYANGVPVSLKYVNITGGNYDTNGAGVVSNDSLSLENCNVYGNSSTIIQSSDPKLVAATGHGGGIYKDGSTLLYVKNCKVYSNESERKGAGIFVNSSTVYIENTKIYDNKSGTWGGGIWNENGHVYIYGGSIIGTASDDTAQYTENLGKYSNRAESGGGGIYSKKGTINIGYYLDEEQELTEDDEHTNSVIYNTANYGGGIYCDRALVRMYNGTINCNYGYQGGGVYLYKSGDDLSKFNIKDSSMSKNNVSNKGGAVYVEDKEKTVFMPMGTVTIDSSSAKNNDVYLYYETDPQKTPVDTAISLNSSSELDSSSHISITPGSYSDTKPKLVGIADADIAQKYKCFSVTKSGNTDYFLSPKAVLTTYQPAETLSSDPGTNAKIGVFSAADITNIKNLVYNGTCDFEGITIELQEDTTVKITSGLDCIGGGSHPFKGTFDGKNHKIIFDSSYHGLFSDTYNATIKNIIFEGTICPPRNSGNEVAPAIRVMKGGTIQNCINKCDITYLEATYAQKIGGLVAIASGTVFSGDDGLDSSVYNRDCIIDGCINKGIINAHSEKWCTVGGIVADARVCLIKNCGNEGAITAMENVGGIAGTIDGYGSDGEGTHILNCYSIGNLTTTDGGPNDGKSYTGGITAGYTMGYAGYKAKIHNCAFEASITFPSSGAQYAAIFPRVCWDEDNNPITGKPDSDNNFTCCANNIPSFYEPGYTGSGTPTPLINRINQLNTWVNNKNGSQNPAPYKRWTVVDNHIAFE